MAAKEVVEILEEHSTYKYKHIERIDGLMDRWLKELKTNVLNEFSIFQSSIEEKHLKAIQQISKTSPEVVRMKREMDKLRKLLQTLEKSVSQKDKLVSILVKALEKEKDKYEKLRAVSSDKFETQNDAEPLSESQDIDVRNCDNGLLLKCWTAWKGYAQVKNKRTTQKEAEVIQVKIETDSEDDEDILLSSGNISPSLSDEDTVDDRTYLPSPSSSLNDVHLSSNNKSDITTYASSISFDSHPVYQTAHTNVKSPAALFSKISTAVQELPPQPAEDTTITVHPKEVLPDDQNSTTTTTRTVKRNRNTSSIASRRNNSLHKKRRKTDKPTKVATSVRSFTTASERPTMAINSFQISEKETGIPTSMSGQYTVQYEPYRDEPPGQANPDSDPSTVMHPNLEQRIVYVNENSSQNRDAVMGNSDRSDSNLTDQHASGGKTNRWEKAKNNISQYVNRLVDQGDAKTTGENTWQTRPAWTGKSSAATSIAATDVTTDVAVAIDDKSSIDQPVYEVPNQQAQDSRSSAVPLPPASLPSAATEPTALMQPQQQRQQNWKCAICKRKYSTKANLDGHMSAVHRDVRLFDGCGSKYICEICGRGFNWRTSHKRHVLVHSGEQPYECRLCGRRFSQKCSHDRHLNVHRAVKPFQCDQCPLSFSRIGTLSRHRVHYHHSVVPSRATMATQHHASNI